MSPSGRTSVRPLAFPATVITKRARKFGKLPDWMQISFALQPSDRSNRPLSRRKRGCMIARSDRGLPPRCCHSGSTAPTMLPFRMLLGWGAKAKPLVFDIGWLSKPRSPKNSRPQSNNEDFAKSISGRRFPPPWTVEEGAACFIMRDSGYQALRPCSVFKDE